MPGDLPLQWEGLRVFLFCLLADEGVFLRRLEREQRHDPLGREVCFVVGIVHRTIRRFQKFADLGRQQELPTFFHWD
jgi:hypothetical protein